MKILVTGATGMVGGEVIREAIKDNDIEQVTALSRKQPEIPARLNSRSGGQNPLPDRQAGKLKTIIHANFLDYSNLSEVFKRQDVIIWCLGISQAQVGKEEYNMITYDYTIAAAKTALAVNPSITFIFLSGQGVDSTERSNVLFARVKGKAENELLRMGFKKLFIARPAGIQPVRKNTTAPLAYKLLYPFYPLIKLIFPQFVITSSELANALLHIAKHGADKIVLENTDLKKIAEG